MTARQEARVRRLPRLPMRWALGYRRLRITVVEEGTHPYIHMVADIDNGPVRASDLQPTPPDVRQAIAVLFDAMLRPMPGSGGPCRPSEVVMDDAALYRELGPMLERIGITPVWERRLPLLDEIARSADAALRFSAKPTGLTGVSGTTPAQLAEFFAAAASFYGADPWQWLGSADPVAVRYPADAGPVFVMLVAGDTEHPGLNVCLSREDLERYMGEGEEDKETGDMKPEVPVQIMFYADASALPPQDVRAIKRNGWVIHSDDAYPIYMCADAEANLTLPSSDDIWRMAAILRKLPEFMHAVGFDQGWVRNTHTVYDLPEPYPERTIALTFPHDLPPGLYEPIEPYEVVANAWCADATRRPLALILVIYITRVIRIMYAQGYAASTIEQYAKSFNAIGWLLCQYGPYDTFTPDIFEGDPPLIDEFRTHVSTAKTAMASYRRAWGKLVEWKDLLQSLPPDLLEPDKEGPA